MLAFLDNREIFLHTMFVENFDSNKGIVECLNSRSFDPNPKLPIHEVLNFYRVTCSATIAQSGQPSKPIKPSPQTAVPISSEVTTSVQTTDRAQENVPAESKRTTEERISAEFDRIPKNVRNGKTSFHIL